MFCLADARPAGLPPDLPATRRGARSPAVAAVERVGRVPVAVRPRRATPCRWTDSQCDIQRWSRFPGQNGGLAKMDSGFDYAASFSSLACVA